VASFLEFSPPNPACTSLRPRTCLIPHPTHPLSFDQPNQPSGLFCCMQQVNTSHHNKSSLSLFLCSRRPQGTRKGCTINDGNQPRATDCNVTSVIQFALSIRPRNYGLIPGKGTIFMSSHRPGRLWGGQRVPYSTGTG
jgi:hypothetical protein